MKKIIGSLFMLLSVSLMNPSFANNIDPKQTEGDAVDGLWQEVARTVKEGDFVGYKATYHDDAVLVTTKTSAPIAQALAKWKQGFDDTKAGKMKASVEFRFGKRVSDATTAHDTGIFLYSATDASGKVNASYVHFEALLVKKVTWKMLMEYQKNEATKAEWDALK